jgi:hypothetical protein
MGRVRVGTRALAITSVVESSTCTENRFDDIGVFFGTSGLTGTAISCSRDTFRIVRIALLVKRGGTFGCLKLTGSRLSESGFGNSTEKQCASEETIFQNEHGRSSIFRQQQKREVKGK